MLKPYAQDILVRILLSNRHETMRMMATDSGRPGLISFGALIALTIALGVVSPRPSFAEESGTRAIPLPPPPVVESAIETAKTEQDANRREEARTDLAQTCMEPEDERVCEMELDLGEVTAPE
jgi:hypothetical protein